MQNHQILLTFALKHEEERDKNLEDSTIHDKEGLDKGWERIYMVGSQTFSYPRLLLKSSSEVEHFMKKRA